MEPVTTSSEPLLWEAIDQVRGAEQGPELSLDELAVCVMAALGSSLSLQQICRASDGLLQQADNPSQGSATRQVPVVDVQAVQARALNFLDWQELEDDDDRRDIQKLIENATDTDTVLVCRPVNNH